MGIRLYFLLTGLALSSLISFAQEDIGELHFNIDKTHSGDTLWLTVTRPATDKPGTLMLTVTSQTFETTDTSFFPLIDTISNYALAVPESMRTGKLAIKGYFYPKIFHINGKINGRKKAESLIALLITNNKKIFNKVVDIDENKTFSLPGLVFENKASLIFNYIHVNKKIKPDLSIDQSPGLKDFTDTVLNREIDITPDSIIKRNDSLIKNGIIPPQLLVSTKKIKVLDNVTVMAKTKSKLEKFKEMYTTELFSDASEKTINCLDDDNILAFPDCLSFLRSRIPGLVVNTDKFGESYIVWRGKETKAFYIDEIEVDIEQIINMDLSSIAIIKAFPPPFEGSAFNGDGGAIAIYTRQGDFVREGIEVNKWLFSVKGYTPSVHTLFEKNNTPEAAR